MKKLYTTILIILLALFISCDEKKAKDEITKAITEITDETENVADNTTPKPQGSGTLTNTKGEEAGGETETEDTPPPALTKPALSDKRAPWNTPIAFPKVPGYTYELKEEKTGVTLRKVEINAIEITATQSAQNVIIVATFDGRTIESNPIEFTKIQGNGLSFATINVNKTLGAGGQATHTQTATSDGTVTGDDRTIVYSIRSGAGATIDSSSGEVTLTKESSSSTINIIAELEEDEKYTSSVTGYYITVAALTIAPALSKYSAPWGEEITFPIEPNHRYELYDNIGNTVKLTIDGTTGRITATQSAKGDYLFVEAILGEDKIGVGFEFTRKQGNTLSFAEASKVTYDPSLATVYQVATNSGTVTGDDRTIVYSISPTGRGGTIDSASGAVTLDTNADGVYDRTFTVTAELPQDEKYTRATATYTVEIGAKK